MQTEIEAKFLDIDPSEIREKLKSLGSKLINPERIMRRKNFDYPDYRLEKIGGWIRVRDEGDKITLSYKQLNDRTLHGTKEIDVIVNDFDNISQLLNDIGLVNYSYQETKRETWEIDGVFVEIDTWPWVPTFLEIEAESESKLKEVANKLGLDWSDALHGSVEIVYQKYYDVTEEEVDNWPEITFVPVPASLLHKKK